jgi:2-polyprenyl-6-methoxyphenol hydroxylase-like FAD-dependent oxidoreductase
MDGVSGTVETSVLIVGGGPVGMTLALDLAWRGIDVVVAEKRPADDTPSVRCGQISARSMEVFRRLGVADKLREAGLPPDYPNDIVSATSVLGIELSRVSIPARGERGTAAATGPDTSWRTPEHTHRVNQKFFEPVLFDHVRAQPGVRIVRAFAVVADLPELADPRSPPFLRITYPKPPLDQAVCVKFQVDTAILALSETNCDRSKR